MSAPFVLVVALLPESSYAVYPKRPPHGVPDTVQFCLCPYADWLISTTFARDPGVYTCEMANAAAPCRLTPDKAVALIHRHYGDVLSRVVVLEFADPQDTAAVTRTLQAHSLRGTLEVASSGVAFYKPSPNADDAQVTRQTSNNHWRGP
jgi:hypothetical protein